MYFTKIYVDEKGDPTTDKTRWIADAFVFIFWVVYIGKIHDLECCPFCDDGTGQSLFPHYGVAPHTCYFRKEGGFNNALGTSDILPKSEWPENFVEDPEVPNLGTYLHCIHCHGKRFDAAEDTQ